MGIRILLYLIGAAGIAAAGWFGYHLIYSSGYEDRDLMCRAEQADMKVEFERVLAAQQRATFEAQQAAQDERERGRAFADKMATELAAAKEDLNNLQRKIDREIEARTSRLRRVFDERLVRMLNELSPIRETVHHPDGTTTTRVDAPPSPAATDRAGSAGRGASERAVAIALKQARAGYEACRQQLHRLIDWAENVTK